MKKNIGIAVLVVACVGVLFMAKPWFDKLLFKIGAKVTTEHLIARAETQKAPDQSLSEALRDVATEESSKRLANTGSVEERRLEASYQFSGFYYINTLFRKNYCQKLGVDISPFVAAFKKENEASYNEAHKIWLKAGIDAEALVMEGSTSFESMIDVAMKDTAQVNGLSLPQTCQMFATSADKLAGFFSLESAQPKMYAALRGQ